MTQEDKELLLKDLCGRFIHGVKVRVVPIPSVEYAHLFFNAKVTNIDVDYVKVLAENGWLLAQDITEIRPYLFPLSSMTKEQKNEYKQFLEDIDGYVYSIDCVPQIDWLNKNHFDYRGLIPMGLAIDATGLNIY